MMHPECLPACILMPLLHRWAPMATAESSLQGSDAIMCCGLYAHQRRKYGDVRQRIALHCMRLFSSS